MSCTRTDLNIDSALADPVIAAAMRADRVDPQRFEALLRSKARSLGRGRAGHTSLVGAVELRLRQAIGGAPRAW